MAAVTYQSSTESFFCSGTVVAPNVVLTAGHCATADSTSSPLDPAQYAVITGSVDWTDAAVRQVSGVSKVIVDPDYDPALLTSDAALLVLSTPTTGPAISLATSADVGLEAGGTGAVISGWGETYQGSGPSTVLQWGQTVVQNPDYCDQFNLDYDSGVQLCAVNYPYDDTATCNGDSGGPLIAAGLGDEPIEIGITSSGPVDCDTVSADFFTTVEPLSTWVGAEVKAVAPVPPAPAPTPSPPPTAQPTLPQMTLGSARSYTKQTLTGVLGKAFKHRHRYQPSCARASSTRFSCGFTFWTGRNDYYGNVGVWFVFGSGDSVEWTDHYTIHWVNDYCYYHSGHRRRCKIHTKRGNF